MLWVGGKSCTLMRRMGNIRTGAAVEIVELANDPTVVEVIVVCRGLRTPRKDLRDSCWRRLGLRPVGCQAQLGQDVIDQMRLRQLKCIVVTSDDVDPEEIGDVTFHGDVQFRCFHVRKDLIQFGRCGSR